MRRHLTEAQDRVLALKAVVMSLFLIMVASLDTARLRRREFLEASGVDGVPLLVLPTVRHDFVGVRADKVTLQAVEVRCLVLLLTYHRGIDTVRTATRYVRAELIEVSPHERVQSFVAGCVLHKPRLVAERISAILSHAVEVGLVFPVPAVGILAVFVESIA